MAKCLICITVKTLNSTHQIYERSVLPLWLTERYSVALTCYLLTLEDFQSRTNRMTD